MTDDKDIVQQLPATPLADCGPVSRAFLQEGCTTLRDAAHLVWNVPYGRNDAPGSLAVLAEGRGTCSTKHALLARLASELGVDGIELRTAIYDMNESNTPGVGAVLASHALQSIPEAHCYLIYAGNRIDLTRADGAGSEPISKFHVELPIQPEQAGDFKRNFHREYLRSVAGKGDYERFDADELWAIREECIAALSRAGSPS